MILFFLAADGYAQFKKTSQNRKDEFSANYFPLENKEDTVIVILNFKKIFSFSVKKTEGRNEFFKYLVFHKTYGPEYDDCIYLRFVHRAGPPFGHEEFLVTKDKVKNHPVYWESKIGFTEWFEMDTQLQQKVMILIDEEDWEGEKEKIRGIQVFVITGASCDDVIDLTEEESAPN